MTLYGLRMSRGITMDNKYKCAFATPSTDNEIGSRGFSKLEYACIHLGVAATGDADLDRVSVRQSGGSWRGWRGKAF